MGHVSRIPSQVIRHIAWSGWYFVLESFSAMALMSAEQRATARNVRAKKIRNIRNFCN